MIHSRLLIPLLFASSFAHVYAVEDPRLVPVIAADDARNAAMLAPSKEKLQALLSEELRYAHSNGVVDTRESFIESLLTKKLQYLELSYEERKFTFPAPDVALMAGKVRLKVKNATGEVAATLMYLGAWKLEGGQWRFLAWQSCKLPAPEAK